MLKILCTSSSMFCNEKLNPYVAVAVVDGHRHQNSISVVPRCRGCPVAFLNLQVIFLHTHSTKIRTFKLISVDPDKQT